jgi:hypothetical protein
MSVQVLSPLELLALAKSWSLAAAEAALLVALAEQEDTTTTLPHIYHLAL